MDQTDSFGQKSQDHAKRFQDYGKMWFGFGQRNRIFITVDMGFGQEKCLHGIHKPRVIVFFIIIYYYYYYYILLLITTIK